MEFLPVTSRVSIPLDEITFIAARSGGPGGQHVNTTSSKVTLLFDLDASPSLTEADKARIRETLAGRIAFVEMAGFDLGEAGAAAQGRLWWRGGFPRSFLARSDAASFCSWLLPIASTASPNIGLGKGRGARWISSSSWLSCRMASKCSSSTLATAAISPGTASGISLRSLPLSR